MFQHSLSKVSSATDAQFAQNIANNGLTRDQIIATERKLAKFANTMDALVRIPFTQQGVGADAALSTVPLVGDVAGLILTGYAFILGRQLGVPTSKLIPAARLAVIDLFVGIVPVAGTAVDIFIRPSRRTLKIVRQHVYTEYGIEDTYHIDRPFLQQSLEKKQQSSKSASFWRHPIVAWVYLHIPDILGALLLIVIGLALWGGIKWLMTVF